MGDPQNGWFMVENPFKNCDLEVPPFRKPPCIDFFLTIQTMVDTKQNCNFYVSTIKPRGVMFCQGLDQFGGHWPCFIHTDI